MFQCPYFFFDVVYIHNGADEKEEEMSWKVRLWQVWVVGGVDGMSPNLGLGDPTFWILVIQSFSNHFHMSAGSLWGLSRQWSPGQVASCPPQSQHLLLSAFALAVLSASITLPLQPPWALLVIHIPVLN